MARLCLCQHQLSKHTRVGGRARGDAHVHPFTLAAGAPELTLQVKSVVGCTSDFPKSQLSRKRNRNEKKLKWSTLDLYRARNHICIGIPLHTVI